MPKNVDLKFACKLKPQKVIDYFEAKGYKTSWDWHEVYQEAHTKAFTVAKVTQMDVLQDIRNAVQQSIDEGETFVEFKKKLEPTLKQKGWWGKKEIEAPDGTIQKVQLGSERRLKTIYDCNIRSAYSAGRYKEMIDNVKDRPFWQYVSLLAPTTRPSHAALHGKVIRFDDPFWNTHYPPNGWNCKCRVRALDQNDVEYKNLEVESSEGKLINKDVKISKNSLETKPITGFRTKDAKGKEITVYTDAGWNYNVGKTAYKAELEKYHQNISGSFRKDLITDNVLDAQKIAKKMGVVANYEENLELANLSNQAIADLRMAGHTKSFAVESNYKKFKALKPQHKDNYDNLIGFANTSEDTIYLNSNISWNEVAKKTTKDFNDNFISSKSPKHVILHEIGHYLHFKHSIRPHQTIKMDFPENEKVMIIKEVSEKAAESSQEFVAEIFAGIIAGKKYNQKIMDLYNSLGGA